MVGVRHALSFAFAAALLLLPVAARADHCDLPEKKAELKDLISLSFEGASYRTARYEGSYEGLTTKYSRSFGDFGLRAAVPVYRLMRNGMSYAGLGDILLGGSYSGLSFSQGRQTFGFSFDATLPTGSREEDLGMGHVMLMPQVFGTLSEGAFLVSFGLGYGGAIAGGSSGHSHGGAMPLVSPMNASEVTGQALGVWSIHPAFRTRVGLSGALPTSTSGVARAIGTLGAEAEVGQLVSRVEAQTALVGDPFEFKLVSTLGLRF